jgi:hypothetical protein
VVDQAANSPNGPNFGVKPISGLWGLKNHSEMVDFFKKSAIFKNFKFAQNSPKLPIRAQNWSQKPDRSIRGVMTLIHHLFCAF